MNLYEACGEGVKTVGKKFDNLVSRVNREILAREEITKDEVIEGYEEIQKMLKNYNQKARSDDPLVGIFKEHERVTRLHVLKIKGHSPENIAKMDVGLEKMYFDHYLTQNPQEFAYILQLRKKILPILG